MEDLSAPAYRTLGVAHRPFEKDMDDEVDKALEEQLGYLGVVGIIDPPRAEAATALVDARRAGIRVMMITADHPITAARIAADLGIVEPGAQAHTGRELSRLEAQGWQETVRVTSVYARVAPEHKLKIFDALQADGNVFAMTGDGVNDASGLILAGILGLRHGSGGIVRPLLATQILWINLVTDFHAGARHGCRPRGRRSDGTRVTQADRQDDRLGDVGAPDLARPGDGRGRAGHHLGLTILRILMTTNPWTLRRPLAFSLAHRFRDALPRDGPHLRCSSRSPVQYDRLDFVVPPVPGYFRLADTPVRRPSW